MTASTLARPGHHWPHLHRTEEPAADLAASEVSEHRRRVARMVDAVERLPGVDLLSAGVDPQTGTIRLELLAPTISASARGVLETRLRAVADGAAPAAGAMAFEFVASPLG